MERVHGIGGVAFRSREPKTLAHWHEERLGVGLTPTGYQQSAWQHGAGRDALA